MLQTHRVFVNSKKGKAPTKESVMKWFKCERVHFIAPIGDNVFTVVITREVEDEK